MTAGARLIARRNLAIEAQGLEHLPESGPVVVAARHVHHLYDGCALMTVTDRPVRILVGLDWVRGRTLRGLMEWACRAAGWPILLRPERLARQEGGAYRPDEVGRYLLGAVRDSVALLRAGELLVVFPEAYPNIDPHYTPKRADDDFLPFRPGFARLVALAQRGGVPIPIVPAGLAYRQEGGRWHVRLRLGAPLYLTGRADAPEIVRLVEEQVHLLSEPVPVGRTAPSEAGAVVPQEAVQP
jgi:putative membrane protein